MGARRQSQVQQEEGGCTRDQHVGAPHGRPRAAAWVVRRGPRAARWVGIGMLEEGPGGRAGPGLAGAQVKGARRRALPSGRCSPRVQRRACCGSCRAGRPSPGSLWSSRPGAGDGLDGGGPFGGEPLLPGCAWAEDGAPSGTDPAGQWGRVIGLEEDTHTGQKGMQEKK